MKSTNLVSVEYLCSVVQVAQLQDHAQHFLVVYSTTIQHWSFAAMLVCRRLGHAIVIHVCLLVCVLIGQVKRDPHGALCATEEDNLMTISPAHG